MIIHNSGNVLDVPHGVIVHGCNSHGVMRSGIAKEVVERFPGAFEVYRKEYDRLIAAGRPGLPLGTFTAHWVSPTKVIVNAITQKDYGRDPNRLYVDYEALGWAFLKLTTIDKNIRTTGLVHGIHFPKIGCGLANGDWGVVSQVIDQCVANDFKKNYWEFQP